MAFTKITNQQLNSRGATTLPNVPTIPASELKREFDAPAKEIVAPAVNVLIDDLEAETAAASIGIEPPEEREGRTIKALVDNISSDLKDVEDAVTTIVVGEDSITLGVNDTLEIEAGANISLVVDDEEKKIKIISAGGSGGSGVWGAITGDIEDQQDLQSALGDINDAISGLSDDITELSGKDVKRIVRTGVTASADGTVRIPGSGTNSLISTASTCVIKPICDYKSDGTQYKFTSFKVYSGYAEIVLAEAISNVNIGVEVTKYS